VLSPQLGLALLSLGFTVFLFYAFTQVKTSSEHFVLAFFFLALHFGSAWITASAGLQASHCTTAALNETEVTSNKTVTSYGETCVDRSSTADAWYVAMTWYARLGFIYVFFYALWRGLGQYFLLPPSMQQRYNRRYGEDG